MDRIGISLSRKPSKSVVPKQLSLSQTPGRASMGTPKILQSSGSQVSVRRLKSWVRDALEKSVLYIRFFVNLYKSQLSTVPKCSFVSLGSPGTTCSISQAIFAPGK